MLQQVKSDRRFLFWCWNLYLNLFLYLYLYYYIYSVYSYPVSYTHLGIDTTGVRYDDNVHTTLAFVQTAADGDRDFSFYRNPGADMTVSYTHLDVYKRQIKGRHKCSGRRI